MKHCKKCGNDLPFTSFGKNKRMKDGYQFYCKECSRKENQRYYTENKEKVNAKNRRNYEENKEERLKQIKNWSNKNREKRNQIDRRSYIKHKAKRISKSLKWIKENPEKHAKRNQERRATIRNLEANFTSVDWEKCKSIFNNTCAYCGKKSKLQQEHVIPVSKGGTYTKDNILPACKSCNSSKNNRDFATWYKSYKHYNEVRGAKIYQYIKKGVAYDKATLFGR